MTMYITHFVNISLRVNIMSFLGTHVLAITFYLIVSQWCVRRSYPKKLFFTAQLVHIAMFLSQRTIPCYSIPHSDRQP